MPHRWVDLDRDPLAPLRDVESVSTDRLPLALFPDGTQLEGPEEEYAELTSIPPASSTTLAASGTHARVRAPGRLSSLGHGGWYLPMSVKAHYAGVPLKS